MKTCQFSDDLPLLHTSPVPVLKMNTIALHTPCTPSSYQNIQEPSSFNWSFCSLEKFPTVSFQDFIGLTPFLHPRAKHQLKPPSLPWLPGFVGQHHNTTFSPSSPPALCALAVLFLRNFTDHCSVLIAISSHSVSYPCSFQLPGFREDRIRPNNSRS